MAIKRTKVADVADERRQKKRQKKTEEVPSWLPVANITRYFRELRKEVNDEYDGEDRDTQNEEMEERFREDLLGGGDFNETMVNALQEYSETVRRKRKLTCDETSDLINDEIKKALNYFCKSKIVPNCLKDSIFDSLEDMLADIEVEDNFESEE